MPLLPRDPNRKVICFTINTSESFDVFGEDERGICMQAREERSRRRQAVNSLFEQIPCNLDRSLPTLTIHNRL